MDNIMPLSFIVIGAAITALFGLVGDYFFLEELIAKGQIDSKEMYYAILLSTYLLLLIPPWIAHDDQRSDNAKQLALQIGGTLADIAIYASIATLVLTCVRALW